MLEWAILGQGLRIWKAERLNQPHSNLLCEGNSENRLQSLSQELVTAACLPTLEDSTDETRGKCPDSQHQRLQGPCLTWALIMYT